MISPGQLSMLAGCAHKSAGELGDQYPSVFIEEAACLADKIAASMRQPSAARPGRSEAMSKRMIDQETIDEVKSLGGQMSNVMFNLGQRDNIDANERAIFRNLYAAWDVAVRKLVKSKRKPAKKRGLAGKE